jgi:neutral ceramidase
LAEIDITPPLGTRKIGWIKVIHGDHVLDPLFARVAVLEDSGQRWGVVQLDTLSVRCETTQDIRRRVEAKYGFPGANIMVTATHNHAGPATATIGDVKGEPEFVETMMQKIVSCFGQALERLQPAEAGIASMHEFGVGFNRRVIMRDGTVKTHGRFSDPNALCLEGPVDPELCVIALRSKGGELLGTLVNFTCHPAHHGGDTAFSAGWPGCLAREMKSRGCPITMLINGAQGNISTTEPMRDGVDHPMEEIGRTLANDISALLPKLQWRSNVKLDAKQTIVSLPFRRVTEAEIKGTIRGAQRFIDSSLYDKNMPEVLRLIKERGEEKAEVQALFLDEYAFVGIPAELFVELGLALKERAHPKHALVFGLANGMVGYVPHKAAFERGGYETTFCGWSKLAPEAGDMLVEAGLRIIRSS